MRQRRVDCRSATIAIFGLEQGRLGVGLVADELRQILARRNRQPCTQRLRWAREV
jgi:hypothetical protein